MPGCIDGVPRRFGVPNLFGHAGHTGPTTHLVCRQQTARLIIEQSTPQSADGKGDVSSREIGLIYRAGKRQGREHQPVILIGLRRPKLQRASAARR